jgi:non-specific serine/threonine protein kinase
LKELGDTTGVRQFNSYLLAIITYLRQSLVCPLIPITNVAIDMADFQSRSELSEIFTKEIKNLNLDQWLNEENSLKSTRIQEVIKTIDKHINDRVLIFSTFRTSIDMLTYFIKDREVFTISSEMNVKKREQTQTKFEESKNGILLLTYELGSEGLNLQCSSVVLLVDFWWNGSTTNQAIARILRFGQQSKEVNVYYFTSNTGLEKAIFDKQFNKFVILEELQTGPSTTKIPKMKVQDIIRIIDMEDNTRLLENILKY